MHQQFWSDILQLLEAHVGKDAVALWITPLRPVLLAEDKCILEASNQMHQRIVSERYLKIMNRCARALTGRKIDFDFILTPQNSIPQPLKSCRKGLSKPGLRSPGFAPNPHYIFKNFVVGRCNRAACGAARYAASRPGGKHNPLFITGPAGLGKTHLLNAVAAETDSHRRHSFIFITSDLLIDQFMEAYKNSTIHRLRKKFSSIDLLLIDDIHFLSGKNQLQEEFFVLFNNLCGKKSQIVLTSDRPPHEIPHLEKRLVARFQTGSVVGLSPPDLKTRLEILKNKSNRLGVTLPKKSLMLLAGRIRKNIRRMEGALNKIAAYSAISGSPVDEALVEEILNDSLFEGDEEGISARKIQQKVVEYFDIKFSDLLRHTRLRCHAYPRQIAMYLCRKMLNSSTGDIGAAFSGRNHSTVIHACKAVEDMRQRNSAVRDTLDEIETAIRSYSGGRGRLPDPPGRPPSISFRP